MNLFQIAIDGPTGPVLDKHEATEAAILVGVIVVEDSGIPGNWLVELPEVAQEALLSEGVWHVAREGVGPYCGYSFAADMDTEW
jgi:hypothetical protein